VTTVQQDVNPYNGAVQTTTTTTYAQVPQSYARVNYQWQGAYNRRSPFMAPYGVDPHTAEQMMYASQLFREADADYNGVITLDEFLPFMSYLGYNLYPNDAIRLFNMIDTDHSGAIDEREFVAYWIYAIGPGGFRFDYNHHRQHRRPLTVRFGGLKYRSHNHHGGGSSLKLGKSVKLRF